jgi:hypothetical protein
LSCAIFSNYPLKAEIYLTVFTSRKLHVEEVHDWRSLPYIRTKEPRRMRWAGHAEREGIEKYMKYWPEGACKKEAAWMS